MIKLIKEIKEIAKFYELKFTNVLGTWIFRPKDYLQMKLEMIKYKLVTSSRWENVNGADEEKEEKETKAS